LINLIVISLINSINLIKEASKQATHATRAPTRGSPEPARRSTPQASSNTRTTFDAPDRNGKSAS
jgi:hypothetical protein